MFRRLLALVIVTIIIGVSLHKFFVDDFGVRLGTLSNSDVSYIILTITSFLVLIGLISHKNITSYRFVLYILLIFNIIAIISIMPFLLPEEKSAAAIVFSGGLAGIGWMVGHQITLNNHRKQHTLNILLQLRQSAIFEHHKNNMLKEYPSGTLISETDAKKMFAERTVENYKKNNGELLIDSILYILNYYEFICAGIKSADIDRGLVNTTAKSIMINLFHKTKHIIAYGRAQNTPSRRTKDAFNNYLWQLREWGIDVDKEMSEDS